MMVKKISGIKLSKCAPISVRLDPKTKHAADLAARYQRRTLSSYIEWAIEYSLSNSKLEDMSGSPVKLWDIAQKTFDVEDSEKSIKMALYAPNLLSYDEMLIWKIIENHEYFWSNHDAYRNRITGYTGKDLNLDRIRDQWKNILNLADGDQDKIPKKS